MQGLMLANESNQGPIRHPRFSSRVFGVENPDPNKTGNNTKGYEPVKIRKTSLKTHSTKAKKTKPILVEPENSDDGDDSADDIQYVAPKKRSESGGVSPKIVKNLKSKTRGSNSNGEDQVGTNDNSHKFKSPLTAKKSNAHNANAKLVKPRSVIAARGEDNEEETEEDTDNFEENNNDEGAESERTERNENENEEEQLESPQIKQQQPRSRLSQRDSFKPTANKRQNAYYPSAHHPSARTNSHESETDNNGNHSLQTISSNRDADLYYTPKDRSANKKNNMNNMNNMNSLSNQAMFNLKQEDTGNSLNGLSQEQFYQLMMKGQMGKQGKP